MLRVTIHFPTHGASDKGTIICDEEQRRSRSSAGDPSASEEVVGVLKILVKRSSTWDSVNVLVSFHQGSCF